jgi:hypothetical protein
MTRFTWMYGLCVGVLVGVASLGLSACGEGQVQEQVIILGGMGPLTGRNSTFGQSTQQGIQLAEIEIIAVAKSNQRIAAVVWLSSVRAISQFRA